MMNRKISFFLTLVLVLAFAAPSIAAIPVEVSKGKGTVLTLNKQSKRISLSDPSIADLIMISPTELLINGKAIGTTSLIVWDKKEEKRTFFDVFVVGDIGELVEQVRSIAPADADVTIEMVKDSVLLRGSLKNQDTINKIVEISKAYAPKVINHLRIEEPEQVMLEVRVAQINKDKLKELGLGVLGQGLDHGNVDFTAPGLIGQPGGDASAATASILSENFSLEDLAPQIGVTHFPSGISAILKALAGKGLAKVLAKPNLVVRTGENGEFLAGSRIPIPHVGADGTPTITYVEVGVNLKFIPNVLENGMIRLKIDPAEVSSVTGYRGNAPVIDTREVRTSVDLKEGESIILAGLLSEEMKKNIKKVPLLGDIPILGALFRSTRDELVTTELAFFITPRLVKPFAPGEEPELPGEKALTPQEEKEFKWIPVPGRAKPAVEAEPVVAE